MNKRDWIDYCTALIPIFITGFGVLIALLQWRVNKNKLTLDRFHQRFAVFEATKKYIQAIIIAGKLDEQVRIQFLNSTQGSRFIFDQRLAQYLDELYTKSVKIEEYNDELRQGHTDQARPRADLMKWFIGELRAIENRFARYF